jgi:putative CocE/NonD family hydrolase
VSVEGNQSVPMRDGTTLKADVYRPTTGEAVPVILMRTPYDKDGAQFRPGGYRRPEWYAERCYLVVVQDVRGQYRSRGDWYPFASEARDGFDTVEWAARLPGSNGRVGMYGYSYVGATQWLAATHAPPALKAIVPMFTASDYYDDWTYQGGALSQAFAQSWPLTTIARSAAEHRGEWALADEIEASARPDALTPTYRLAPLNAYPPLHPERPEVAGYYFDWLKHPSNDTYWQRWSIRRRYGDIAVPALNIGGWYDVFLNGTLENFTGMRERGGTRQAREGQRVVIGPWDHNSGFERDDRLGDVVFGRAAKRRIAQMHIDWFDRWLKGEDNADADRAPVQVYVMGADRWRHARSWPIPGTEFTDFHLAGDGRLTTQPPEGTRTDAFRYDPRDPAPSVGGHSCCVRALAPMGPFDQRQVERRPDVLVYDTPVLQHDTEVTGPVTVTLHASTTAPDTDFTAKLVDVHPDGKAINLNDGIVRARYRNGEESPDPIVPGEVTRYRIEVWPTSNLFRRGHRIRLEISSSNFPAYDRNPNTGGSLADSTETRVATQTIYRGAEHPSRVTLPIQPRPVR